MALGDELNRLDWEILDALSDDYESIEQLHSLITTLGNSFSCTPHEILDRLQWLHEYNYVFLTLNKTFDRAKLLDEIEGRTDCRPYWFGRTENGYKAWENLTPRYETNEA